ncbi:MAG: peptide/nickel transport system substrate-binding protein [Actinomycetota bacterium]|nr:peptide/nickel transport system substrate-binding protein [Actinomycetota bacterium]
MIAGPRNGLVRKSRLTGLAALIFFLAALSCTSSPSKVGTRAATGGVLRVGVVTNLPGQCPFVLCGAANDDPQVNYFPMGFEVERCCLLRTLLSYNGRSTADGGGVLRPDLAAALPRVSADGLTWTFRLRPGIHYGPPLAGETVRAQDFVRSIERVLSPRPAWLPEPYGPYLDDYLGAYLNLAGAIVGGKAYGQGHAQHIAGLQAPDDHTLVIHLTQVSGNLGYLLSLPDTAPIPPVPSHPEWRFGAAQGHERLYSSYLVSTGPYMIEGAPKLDFSKPPQQQLQATGDAPDSLTLVRNPSWRRATDPLRAALPDRIELVPVKDPGSAQRLINRGVIDFALNWDAPLGRLPHSAITSPRDEVHFLTLNLAMPPLDDVHVRRAINLAIARQPLLQYWNKADLPAIAQSHIGLDDEENNLLLNFDPYHASTGDLKAARREMASSRYDSNHDGRCDRPACKNVRLWADRTQPASVLTARKVARDLKRIGLGVRVYLPNSQKFGSAYQDPKIHVQIRSDAWLKDTPSPTTYFAPLFGGTSVQVTGGVNQNRLGATPGQLKEWGYRVTHVPSVDSRIAQCLALTFGAQVRCYAELDQYLTSKVVPWVPLVSLESARLTSNRVSAFSFDPAPSSPMPSLDRVVLPEHSSPTSLPKDRHPVPPIPNGVYRYTITRSDALRFDSKADPSGLPENTGTVTIYMRDGRYESIQRADHAITNPIAVGRYEGDAHHVTFEIEQPTFNAFTVPKARWRFDGHALHFQLLGCGNLNRLDPSGRFCKDVHATYEAHPWVKVASLP